MMHSSDRIELTSIGSNDDIGTVVDVSADVNTNLKKMFIALQSTAIARHNEIVNKFDDLKQKFEHLKADHDQLESKCEEMSSEIEGLKSSLSQMQQQTLVNNIILRGVPELEENKDHLNTIVAATFKALKVSQELSNIIHCHRLGNKTTTSDPEKRRAILIRMSNEKSKLAIMESKRKVKLDCSQIQIDGHAIGSQEEAVYVEEHLTKLNSSLFAEARKLKTDKIIQFAWTHGGSILVRKKQDEPAQKINSQDDINQLRGQPNISPRKGVNYKRKTSPAKTQENSRNTRKKTAAMAAAALATASKSGERLTTAEQATNAITTGGSATTEVVQL